MTVHERLRPGRYRLRVEDYRRLDEAGAFDGARTELLDGEIVVMNAQHRPHGRVKMAIYDALPEALRAIGSDLHVAVEVSVALSDTDQPEPDLTLTTEPDGDGPIPAPSVALVVEVADASLAEDLGRKLALYARAGMPEYWVADVRARVVHQMAEPDGSAYAIRREVAFGEPLPSFSIPGLTIATDRL